MCLCLVAVAVAQLVEQIMIVAAAAALVALLKAQFIYQPLHMRLMLVLVAHQILLVLVQT
jgi:hypothetical protein